MLPSYANFAIRVSPWIQIRTPIILQEVDASACHMEPNEDLGVQGSLRRFLEGPGFQVAVEPRQVSGVEGSAEGLVVDRIA